MKYLFPLILLLGGCATPPVWLAEYYNSQDPCLRSINEMPSWCGAGSGSKQTIYDSNNRRIGYVK